MNELIGCYGGFEECEFSTVRLFRMLRGLGF